MQDKQNNIFDDENLILQENIFDDENLQNQVFTNAKQDDKHQVLQILEQIEISDEQQNEAENSPCDEQKPEQENKDIEAQNEPQKNEETNKNTTKTEERKYGKFKTPEELLHAYGELEKEFTRRSQKLKELESANENPFASDEAWKAAVDKFIYETPSAKVFAKDIANEIIAHPELKQNKNCLDIALTRALLSKFRTPEQLIEDGQFLKDYVFGSKKIKDAIIAEYLKDVRDGEPPFTLGGGGRQFATSPKNPKTIEEAGFMFLKENK